MSYTHNLPFMAGYARHDRSFCRGCKEGIAADSLRIGIMIEHLEGKIPFWYHSGCFWIYYHVNVVDDIHGFSDLHSTDQNDICGKVKGADNAVPYDHGSNPHYPKIPYFVLSAQSTPSATETLDKPKLSTSTIAHEVLRLFHSGAFGSNIPESNVQIVDNERHTFYYPLLGYIGAIQATFCGLIESLADHHPSSYIQIPISDDPGNELSLRDKHILVALAVLAMGVGKVSNERNYPAWLDNRMRAYLASIGDDPDPISEVMASGFPLGSVQQCRDILCLHPNAFVRPVVVLASKASDNWFTLPEIRLPLIYIDLVNAYGKMMACKFISDFVSGDFSILLCRPEVRDQADKFKAALARVASDVKAEYGLPWYYARVLGIPSAVQLNCALFPELYTGAVEYQKQCYSGTLTNFQQKSLPLAIPKDVIAEEADTKSPEYEERFPSILKQILSFKF